MKKTLLTLAAVLTAGSALCGITTLYLHQTGGIHLEMPVSMADSLYYDEDGSPVVAYSDSLTFTLPKGELLSMTMGEPTDTVDIIFDGDSVHYTNPYAFTGLSLESEGADIIARCVRDDETIYRLSGQTESGSFKLYSEKKSTLVLDGVSIKADLGAAINVQSGKKLTVELPAGTKSVLSDGSKYNTPEGEDEKGCFFSEGQIIFKGDGALEVSGNKKHAIVSDDYVSIEGGDITVPTSKSDAVHVNDYFLMKGGTLTSRETVGDGVDAGTGYIEISGGTIDVALPTADTKGIKADSIINMTGGLVRFNIPSAQSKGFSTKQTMTMTGGTIEGTLTGDAVVVDNDPSYCTLIKTKADFVMSDGSITCTHSGLAGKGISTDCNALFTGGTVNLTMSGGADVYTNTTGENDSYKSTCMKIDGNLDLLGGNFTLTNSGTAGKAINVDGTALIGSPDYELNVTATTTGDPLSEGNSSSGGWWNAPVLRGPGGGGWGPGGGGNAGDYTYPKVIKAEGNMTVKGGNLILHSTKEGGEGLESKQTLSIEGGTIDVTTYDDCLNAANALNISGGDVRCISSNNDAVDSNGTITISGGRLIAVGSTQPECGLDCDQNKFTITGGTVIAMGGDNSTPTSSACTQPVILYGTSVSPNTILTLTTNDGTPILSFASPKTMSSASLLMTTPELVKGSSYAFKTGGTLTGGETFCEMTTGGQLSGGTQATTVTLSSMVTNVGNSGGRPW